MRLHGPPSEDSFVGSQLLEGLVTSPMEIDDVKSFTDFLDFVYALSEELMVDRKWQGQKDLDLFFPSLAFEAARLEIVAGESGQSEPGVPQWKDLARLMSLAAKRAVQLNDSAGSEHGRAANS